jgi:hypothetical protein
MTMIKGQETNQQETGKVVLEGVTQATRGINNDLGRLTTNLDKHLPEINASRMPEYFKVRKSMDDYELALRNRIYELKKEAGI